MSQSNDSQSSYEHSTYEQCFSAVEALKACYERQLDTYGKDGMQEVKRMEDEAPAPSPCMDQYNATVAVLMGYEGSLGDFELGAYGPAIRKALAERR